jgi:hypothetical protein
MLGGAGGNIALQVGSDGALLVDSGRADRADAAIATAAFFRVKNKQITEWLDTPVASAGPPPPAQPGR